MQTVEEPGVSGALFGNYGA